MAFFGHGPTGAWKWQDLQSQRFWLGAKTCQHLHINQTCGWHDVLSSIPASKVYCCSRSSPIFRSPVGLGPSISSHSTSICSSRNRIYFIRTLCHVARSADKNGNEPESKEVVLIVLKTVEGFFNCWIAIFLLFIFSKLTKLSLFNFSKIYFLIYRELIDHFLVCHTRSDWLFTPTHTLWPFPGWKILTNLTFQKRHF